MPIETEFEKECKRLRPEFDIDKELIFNSNSTDEVKQQKRKIPVVQPSNPTNLFDVFLRKKPTEPNPKNSISKPMKSKVKKSLTHSTTQKLQDIRSFFNSNSNHDTKLPIISLGKVEQQLSNPKIKSGLEKVD